jgi:hypothetical protein
MLCCRERLQRQELLARCYLLLNSHCKLAARYCRFWSMLCCRERQQQLQELMARCYVLLDSKCKLLPTAYCHVCSMLCCRERQQQLQELSADTERLDAWAVEFMPNGAKLSQVMADGGGNLTVFIYDKTVRASVFKHFKSLGHLPLLLSCMLGGITALALAVPAGCAAERNALQPHDQLQ